jgi:hypothetical protein
MTPGNPSKTERPQGNPLLPYGEGDTRSHRDADRWEQGRIGDAQANGEPHGLWTPGYTTERDKHLRRVFGFKEAWAMEIWAEQGKRCPVCLLTPPPPKPPARTAKGGKPARRAKSFPLDHDHTAPFEVRGFPCPLCNGLLTVEFCAAVVAGHAIGPGELLDRILAYLTDPPARRVGLRLYGRPFCVPLERQQAMADKAGRASARKLSRAQSRASRAVVRAEGRRQRSAPAAAAAPAASPSPAAVPAPDFSDQLQALMGRAASNQRKEGPR